MVTIPVHRLQILAFAGVSAFLGGSMIVTGRAEGGRLRRWFSYASGGYFLASALELAKVAWFKDAVILGKEGLIDRAGTPPAGFIPWSAIAAVETVTVPVGLLARKFVGIRLALPDPTTGGRRRHWLEPPLLSVYGALIPELVLEPRVEEAVDVIRTYFEDQEERAELGSLVEARAGGLW